jgi:SAM-dependent methyltransferase
VILARERLLYMDLTIAVLLLLVGLELPGRRLTLARSLTTVLRMPTRARPAGDFDYESGGGDYGRQRRADPRIAAHVHAALGDSRSVLNVGAGAGSYEPQDRYVAAVEPSAMMRARRNELLVPAIDATAERLPFDDESFDAAMAVITLHQWRDSARGLAELRRVSRDAVVILTFDGDALDRLWLGEYVPELFEAERHRYPAIAEIGSALGGTIHVQPVPIPIDCIDGFIEAFYARPEQFLDPEVRSSQSAWGFVEATVAERGLARLAGDIETRRWDQRHGSLRTQPEFIGALTLIVSRR